MLPEYIEELVKSHVIYRDLDTAYREMAADKSREAGALEWSEATVGDTVNKAR